MKCVHVFVSGRVQGVFFRAFTKRSADDCGVRGWVRNVADGRVEAFACGDEAGVDSFLNEVKKGPPASRVDDVEVSLAAPADIKEEYDDFRIIY